ncbi:MAG: tripartite tricarboxylate transporter substrate binding protein [Burkholderiales bacterium]
MSSFTGRRLFVAAAACALVATPPLAAFAQPAFPSKPVHMIVPFPPGGVSDAAARLVAEALSKRLGKEVVVENKPGATGNVAGQYVAQSEPDGYTIMLVYNGVLTINPFVFSKMPFDAQKDFTPIGKIGDYPFILTVNPSVPAANLQELIALSKKTPKGLDYGTSGTGSNEHLIATLIVQKTGANLVHVPYKGGGPAMADAMAGHIPIGMASVAGGTALVKSGKLRPIVVSSAERWPSMPDVPTVVESGVPDVVVMSWIGLIGPARIPRPVVERINAELNASLETQEMKDKMMALGVRVTPGTPEAFRDEIRRDYDRFGPVIKAAGITVE